MKCLIQAVVVAAALAALAAPVAVFAQSTNAPVTRAQVRAELVQLEKAGYHPGDGDNTTYPADIQAAEAKVAAQNNAVGGAAAGSSQSGRAADTAMSTYSPRIHNAH